MPLSACLPIRHHYGWRERAARETEGGGGGLGGNTVLSPPANALLSRRFFACSLPSSITSQGLAPKCSWINFSKTSSPPTLPSDPTKNPSRDIPKCLRKSLLLMAPANPVLLWPIAARVEPLNYLPTHTRPRALNCSFPAEKEEEIREYSR